MDKETRTNSDFQPYRQDVFDAFVLWLSLPAFLKNPDSAPKGMSLVSFGIEDEAALELIGIKTQKQFAERFSVDADTLTAWKEKARSEAQQATEKARAWAEPLTKNVLLALYRKIMDGTAQGAHFKLWFEIVHGWKEQPMTQSKAERPFTPMTFETIDLREQVSPAKPQVYSLKRPLTKVAPAQVES